MKVSFVGISLRSGADRISHEDFYSWLTDQSGLWRKAGEHDRYFYFHQLDGDKSNYVVGLVLTVKDQKKFCKANIQAGDFEVETEDVIDGKIADFNFFALDKNTRKGIFQYYHNSCSPTAFGAACKSVYSENKRHLISQEKDRLIAEGSEDDDATYEKAKRKYAGRPKFAVLLDPRDIGQIIADFDELSEIDITYEAPEAPLSDGEPDAEDLDAVKITYRVAAQRQPQTFVEHIRNAMNSPGFKRGRVKGKNEDSDEERAINLLRVPHDFGQADFDDYAEKVNNLNSGNFYDNQIVGQLLDKIESTEYSHVFGTP